MAYKIRTYICECGNKFRDLVGESLETSCPECGQLNDKPEFPLANSAAYSNMSSEDRKNHLLKRSRDHTLKAAKERMG